jgi:hypothetical protein
MESRTRTSTRTPHGVALAAAIWLIAVGAAMLCIMRYSVSPGSPGRPPLRWPGGSIARSTDLSTLLLFVHPHCPCSRATLSELEVLLAQSNGLLKTFIVFAKPPGAPEDWSASDLWQTARRISGATTIEDAAATEARRFNVETSGTALLYSRSGGLLFHGGLTRARGHSGDNAGRDALLALAQGTVRKSAQTPVFGCPLFNETCGTNSHAGEVSHE